MSDLLSGHLHYHSSFVLEQARPTEGDWHTLVKMIREWVSEHVRDRSDWSRWFESGGSFQVGSTTVQTKSVLGQPTSGSWRYWAVRLEHPDREFNARIWRTDVGIEVLEDGKFAVSVTNYHFVRAGYVGNPPPPPPHSAPKFVRTLLDSRFWRARAGSESLCPRPRALLSGDGEDVRKHLESAGRECPIILVSRFSDGRLPVDVDRVQRLVAGAAVVYVSESPAMDEELDWCLPEGFRCFKGMVRIYQPEVKFAEPRNARRHWFIKPRETDPTHLEEWLVRAICQLPLPPRASRVRTVEDVEHKERELRLAELKETAPYGSSEWVDLLTNDNQNLTVQVKALEEKNFQLELEIESLRADLDDTRRDSDRRSYEFEQRLASARTRGENVDLAVTDLERLPESMIDVVDLAAKAFPNRLFFTERARDSAREASYSNSQRLWTILRAMAVDLHPLNFSDPPIPLREIVSRFQATSGLEIGIGESSLTRNNRRLAALREVEYQGETLDISTHIKVGNRPPHVLRIHYHPHRKDRLLVIGHCGDHLDTATTN